MFGMYLCVCCWVCWVCQVHLMYMQISPRVILMCMWDRFCVWEQKWVKREERLFGHTLSFTQAVICELGECVGSVSRELGFTTLEQRSWEACMRFNTSASPPHLFSICPSRSLPSLSVCLLPDSEVCQELDLPPFPPSAAGMHVPPCRCLPLPLPPSQAPFSDATNFAFF